MDYEITLLVIGPNGKTSAGTATVRNFSQSARLVNSLKKAAACFIAAVLSVLVPVLHFILVPSLLVGAILTFISTYKRQAIILNTSSNCPVCSKGLSIGKVEPNWPLSISCVGCSTQVYIQDAAIEPLISISMN